MSWGNIFITIAVFLFFAIGYYVEKKLFERRNQNGDHEIWPF